MCPDDAGRCPIVITSPAEPSLPFPALPFHLTSRAAGTARSAPATGNSLGACPTAEAEGEMACDKTSRQSQEPDAEPWYPGLMDFVALEKEF